MSEYTKRQQVEAACGVKVLRLAWHDVLHILLVRKSQSQDSRGSGWKECQKVLGPCLETITEGFLEEGSQ